MQNELWMTVIAVGVLLVFSVGASAQGWRGKEVPPLKDVFQDYFYIGAAVSPRHLDEQGNAADLLAYHYNILTAENAMKPDGLQPIEGQFTWKDADAIVDFAEQNQMKLRGHTLVWHNQIPSWFFLDPENPDQLAEADLLIGRLENHIKTVIGRYRGRVYAWDVVNEVLNDSGNIRAESDGSKWSAIIGDLDEDGYDSDYIELAFKFAREADPDAKLFINDYGLESPGPKRQGMYRLVKRLLEKGIPIDGVGLQMHISIYSPTIKDIEETIELFATLKEYNPDFTVEVTELDVSFYRWDEPQKEITAELLDTQAERYDKLFEMFRRQAEKGNLSAVVMWGVDDSHSWLNNFPVRGRGNAPLLFDHNLEPKPAFYQVVQSGEPWYVTKGRLLGETAAENLVKDRPINASHRSERAVRAVDGDRLTSWSTGGEPPFWLSIDLGSPHILTRWVVYHRGSSAVEAEPIDGAVNTADFALQISDDGTAWRDADTVEGNSLGVTDRVITPVAARYARLLITKPSSLDFNQDAVIYEFEVYGFKK